MTSGPVHAESLAPVPPSVRSIVVFGGTFDPPHRAHVELPRLARDAVHADWLLYIPAARSPHKDALPGASGIDRLAMLRLAIADDSHSSASSIELASHSNEPSYTVNTIGALRALLGPEVKLRLLIGADQAASFHRWRSPHQIITLAEPLVMMRSPADSWDALRAQMETHWSSEEIERWKDRIVRVPLIDVSATRVRELLALDWVDAKGLDALIPAPVLGYIREHRLYKRR